MKTLMAICSIAALVASSGSALAQDKFEQLDSDASGTLTEEELTAGLDETGAYGEWDTDSDKVISQDEFALGLFDWVDEDDDDQVAPEEFGVLNDVFPE